MTAEGGKLGTRNSIKLSRHLIRMPRGKPWSFSRHVRLGGDPGADPKHTGEIRHPNQQEGVPQEELEDMAGETGHPDCFFCNRSLN